MQKAPPSLIIFDCDGVLVDSERIADESMRLSLQELGLEMSPKEIRTEFMGLSWPDCIIKIEKMSGAKLPDGWLERTQVRDKEWFLDRLEPVPGITQVVEHLHALPHPFCVASSGDVEKMHVTLGITKLLPYFEDVMFSATMVDRGKPHPDLFLYAAEQMGHAPQDCVVIEDSIYGVQGARAAGMRVLAYAGDPHADSDGLSAAGGDVFHDMEEVLDLIGLT